MNAPLAALSVALVLAVPERPGRLAPVVRPAVRHDVSAPLRDLPPAAAPAPDPGRPEVRRLPKALLRDQVGRGTPVPPAAAATGPREAMPGPRLSWDGLGNVNGRVPPDPSMDVGPAHVVQWVNLSFAVWDRQGTLLYGPVPGHTLWAGFGGICETTSNGDPIVQHDALADRWILTQLAFVRPTEYHQCVAVSQTPDPTGAWHRYDFLVSTSKLNDYPKLGVWPDAYYLAVNFYDGATNVFSGQGAMALERAAMLAGAPARMVLFDLSSVDANYGGALPSDLDGPRPPPEGAPNWYVEMDDGAWWPATDQLALWGFHVDWADPEASTFGQGGLPDHVLDLEAAGHPFDSDLCGYSRSCIPQPGGARVDGISDRLMWRLAYRNHGTHESLVVNHSVDVIDEGDRAGIRWYELRDPGGTPHVHQAGTFSPDADHRWMGSAAADGTGAIALGYSVSSTATSPSIRYAGRLAGDPPGQLTLAETALVAGSGYQTGASRWGDYSSMVVDPTDDCTFWYTQQYYDAVSSIGWKTRIGAFALPGCPRCPGVGAPELSADREGAATRLAWAPGSGADAHDVARGSLTALRAASGDFAAASASCAARGLAGSTLRVEDGDPAPGEGAWYLVRPVRGLCRGSWDEPAPARAAPRDATLAACP